MLHGTERCMGLRVNAHRSIPLYQGLEGATSSSLSTPPLHGVRLSAPTEALRSPNLDQVDQVKNPPEIVEAEFTEIEEPHYPECRDEYVAIAPDREYRDRFRGDDVEAFKNFNRYNPDSTLQGTRACYGDEKLAQCRKMLLG